MSRVLSVERTYALKQYENIKLFDQIIIPDGKEMDLELVDQVRNLQYAQLELHFLNYIKTIEKIHPYKVDEAISVLEETKLNILNDLLKGE